MGPDELLDYALAKPGAWADEPWDGHRVAKVADKMFLFTGEGHIGVKCGATREEADALVAAHPAEVQAMPYLGRYGWNRVTTGGGVSDDELRELVDESYDAVVARLPKGKRPHE